MALVYCIGASCRQIPDTDLQFVYIISMYICNSILILHRPVQQTSEISSSFVVLVSIAPQFVAVSAFFTRGLAFQPITHKYNFLQIFWIYSVIDFFGDLFTSIYWAWSACSREIRLMESKCSWSYAHVVMQQGNPRQAHSARNVLIGGFTPTELPHVSALRAAGLEVSHK